MPTPSPTEILNNAGTEVAWVELAHKYGVDLVFAIAMLVLFILTFRWLMTKVDAKLTELKAAIEQLISIQAKLAEELKVVNLDNNSHKDCTKDNFYALKSQHEKFASSIESFDTDIEKILNYLNDIVQENKVTSDKVKYIMDNILKLYERCAGGRGKDE